MDPVENVRRQRELAARILSSGYDENVGGEAVELAGLVQAFIEWRDKGGFDPFRYTWRPEQRLDMPTSPEEWAANCAFYRLTVDQRDRAWAELERLKGDHT